MGGYSYDRDVYSSSSSSSWGSSSVSDEKLSASSLDKSMLPKKTIKSDAKNPIVIMLDVTGSNIDFAKIVYDKMPMFFGNIEQKGYLKDFEISVCAVGDANSDSYPLQISNFAKGKEIDSWLEKLVLEGCGGGQRMETYELGAYYLLKNAEFRADAEPIVFFIADESPYPYLEKDHVENLIGGTFDKELINTDSVFMALRKKCKGNVFTYLNKYSGREDDIKIVNDWNKILKSEHLIKIGEEKAIVDLMLGTIALIGNRTLESYKVDMLDRGQEYARISTVASSLKGLSSTMLPAIIVNKGLTNNFGVVNKTKKDDEQLL
ncbi:MAG: hypothetical protein WCR30_01500 [Clostridia bacterium]